MSRCRLLACALVAMLALASLMSHSSAQNSNSTDASQGEVVLTKLFTPVYPPVARQACITGDVVLTIGIRQDGSVESAVAVSGHPLLKQAALDSAQQSQFECRKCNQTVTSYQLQYTFQLEVDEPSNYCAGTKAISSNDQPSQLVPLVSQSQNHVTIRAYFVPIIDYGSHIEKARSLKCLYLWRCGLH
jgi:TonB family protein